MTYEMIESCKGILGAHTSDTLRTAREVFQKVTAFELSLKGWEGEPGRRDSMIEGVEEGNSLVCFGHHRQLAQGEVRAETGKVERGWIAVAF